MAHSKTFKKIAELAQRNLISAENQDILEQVADQFDIAVPETLADLINVEDPADPIAKQFIPSALELMQLPEESTDPVGDNKFEQVKGLVHRYPDRCLLKVVNVCAVYCRFCFRREMIGAGSYAMSAADLALAYQYISNHPEIWEVILTGGDPLVLKPEKLGEILQALSAIKHVTVLRIHTRIPVASPERVTAAMVAALKVAKPVFVTLHANHSNEFSELTAAACARIIDSGIPMLSQSVLLKGVNDDIETLSQLMRTLVSHRIKPYYLHHLDYAKGTSHFRVPIAKGQALMRGLQGRFSGLCQPTYVLDIPGGAAKVPIGPSYVRGHDSEADKWAIEDYLGNVHMYK